MHLYLAETQGRWFAFRLRGGLESLSSAHAELGAASATVWKAAGDVARQLPAITTEDITQLTYAGAPLTADRVGRARAELGLAEGPGQRRSKRRASAPAGITSAQRSALPFLQMKRLDERGAACVCACVCV